MVVSKSTAGKLAELVIDYVPASYWGDFIEKLDAIDGNKSFRDTVELIKVEVLKRKIARRSFF